MPVFHVVMSRQGKTSDRTPNGKVHEKDVTYAEIAPATEPDVVNNCVNSDTPVVYSILARPNSNV